MGLSTAQLRFFQYTRQKNNIGLRLSQLSNDKVSLSREMQKISREYNDKINQKTLKWTNNGGASYIDLSYQNLMKPSVLNHNKPYLITDESDHIVIDKSYLDYAQMISPDGSAGGNWDSIRAQVISDLTGIDPYKISTSNIYQEAILSSEALLNSIKEEEEPAPTKTTYIYSFLDNLNGKNNKVENWGNAYTQSKAISISGDADFKALIDSIGENLGQFVSDKENFKKACETFYNANSSIVQDPGSYAEVLSSTTSPINGSAGNLTVNTKKMIDNIIGAYSLNSCNITTDELGSIKCTWIDINSPNYTEWKTEHDEWQTRYDNAYATYSDAISQNDQLFTADEESLIKFYDNIFSSVAENGWVCNNKINNPDYLNQMLQNNLYTITTVDRSFEYDEKTSGYVWDNDYSTTIASNFKNIICVNNSDAQNKALVEFEYKERKIKNKESRIDQKMATLETEQAAINQMLQSLGEIKGAWIEKLNVFS